MNDIYKVLKYIKEYIEDPKVIKDPMLQKIYVGAAAKANKLSKKHGTHYVLYDPSIAKLAVVAKSNLKSEVKEKGLTKNTAVLYVAKGKEVSEVAPKGWEGTVKAMKNDGDVDNPWALAWWMKNKGYKSHKKEVKEWHTGKRKDRVKQAKNQSEVLGYKMVGEVEEPSWDLTKKADRGDNIGEQKLSEISSKVKREIQNIMKYDHIDDLADYIEQFDIDKKHWRVISHYFDNIRDEVQGLKPSGYADKSRKELQKVLFKVIKEGKLNEFNKAHFLNLIKQEIESLKGQIAYAKDKVNYKGTADWEKKEFKAVLKDKIKDLAKTIKHYKKVQSMKEGQLDEKAKRDYKAEYKKFQSSKKAKKYRAELNAYNRKKGTYGNGDGKDASHKGGKIVGFESQSKNRGRREKSRLKKEAVWQLPRGFKASDVDELDAELYRAGLRGAIPDFNKGTITWNDKPGRIGGLSRIKSILKKHKAKLIKEISSSDAKTLLKQLGGGRFMAMTGAKDFGIGSDGLHFKIGRNSKSISHVVIDYNRGKDLYEMKFLRVRAGKINVIKKVDNVYFDQLGTIFKKYTGMNVRL